jgi:hypothetical protein
VGPTIARQLDAMAIDAMQQVSEHLSDLWTQMSHRA